MKISVVIAGENAPEKAFVVWRGLSESIRKAARIGYDGVELALGTKDDVQEAELDAYLQKNAMTVSCVSTGLTYAKYGYYLTSGDMDVRARAEDALSGLIRLASRYGQLVTMGRVRGFIENGVGSDTAASRFAESLIRLNRLAAQEGVRLAVEPINRYESNFINSVDEAALFLRPLGLSNVGILADLFHMNIEDAQPLSALARNAKQIFHVHIADSNRKAPGMGHTDFGAVLDTLKGIGYRGWLSAEILPGDSADDMAQAAITHMRLLDNAKCKKITRSCL